MRALLGRFALLLLLPTCGGTATTAGEPRSASDRDAPAAEPATRESERTDASSDDDSAAEAPSKPSCDDGTCSVCGSGICPKGWYCDEKRSACSWLTECAEKPTCSCVTRVLGASCQCRDEGGLKVSCD